MWLQISFKTSDDPDRVKSLIAIRITALIIKINLHIAVHFMQQFYALKSAKMKNVRQSVRVPMFEDSQDSKVKSERYKYEIQSKFGPLNNF